jgi:tetratricopeptide (TPR) repeat protein
MDLTGRTVALYGRFAPQARERLEREITRSGGHVLRDLTRRCDAFVVGSLAAPLVDSGALGARLAAARARSVPIRGERALAAELAGEKRAGEATFPLATALARSALTKDDADILAAFDLIEIAGEACRFADAGVLQSAAGLIGKGKTRGEAVRILMSARDLAPVGRHDIVVSAAGDAALKWGDGSLTTLGGQGWLPLDDDDHPGLEAMFEAAALAEADGDMDEAARLYDQCARADRRDAIAPYNLGNIRLAQGACEDAVLAYRRALERDAGFIEARYNLSQALDAAGKADAAAAELARVLDADPTYADAVFNLARLRMKAGQMAAAKALYQRFLELDPPADWAATARKAIAVCSAAAGG